MRSINLIALFSVAILTTACSGGSGSPTNAPVTDTVSQTETTTADNLSDNANNESSDSHENNGSNENNDDNQATPTDNVVIDETAVIEALDALTTADIQQQYVGSSDSVDLRTQSIEQFGHVVFPFLLSTEMADFTISEVGTTARTQTTRSILNSESDLVETVIESCPQGGTIRNSESDLSRYSVYSQCVQSSEFTIDSGAIKIETILNSSGSEWFVDDAGRSYQNAMRTGDLSLLFNGLSFNETFQSDIRFFENGVDSSLNTLLLTSTADNSQLYASFIKINAYQSETLYDKSILGDAMQTDIGAFRFITPVDLNFIAAGAEGVDTLYGGTIEFSDAAQNMLIVTIQAAGVGTIEFYEGPDATVSTNYSLTW